MEGKIALVTGGAQSIGKEYSTELLKNGARVSICDIDQTAGTHTVQELKAKFGDDNVEFFSCDVTDPKQFEDCFKHTVKKFGGLNIVVNNAGIVNETEEGWRKMIEVNLIGVAHGTKLGFKYMSRSNGGDGGLIVNIGSITALRSWDSVPVYSSTKLAVIQLSRCYGTDFHCKSTGVKVVAINPGLTDTNILKDAANNKLNCVDDDKIKGDIGQYPIQSVENMGKGLINVIKTAPNGSVWTIENNEPPKLSTFYNNN